MALGLTSDSDFLAELERLQGKVTPKPIIRTVEGRGPNIPQEIKKLAAEEYINGATQKEVATALAVTMPTVSASAHGFVGTNDNRRRDEVLTKHVNNVKNKISRRASRTLIKAIEAISEEKLEELGPVAASTVARNMSAIVREMEPEDDEKEMRNRPQVVIIAPRERDIQDFEVVRAVE